MDPKIQVQKRAETKARTKVFPCEQWAGAAAVLCAMGVWDETLFRCLEKSGVSLLPTADGV